MGAWLYDLRDGRPGADVGAGGAGHLDVRASTLTGARRAVVTGATGGIGRECAEVLAGGGYDVHLVGRRPDELADLGRRLGASWAAVASFDEASLAAALPEDASVDLVVHTAGRLANVKVKWQSLADFENMIKDNLSSAYAVARAFLPAMGDGGRFVFVSSIAATNFGSHLSAYGAAKAGVRALAGALRAEVESTGIAVHTIMPGLVDTQMASVMRTSTPALLPGDIAEIVRWLDQLPTRIRIDELTVMPSESHPSPHSVRVDELAVRSGGPTR